MGFANDVFQYKKAQVTFLVAKANLFTGALHIESLVVPAAAKLGDDLQLSCHYHLDDTENLYALRWYKDEKEFFRYMPKETPAQRFFNVSGIRINVSDEMKKSNRLLLWGVIKYDERSTGVLSYIVCR